MRRCAQSSQRSTCPPSAAVRQRSIADITLSWPRLIRPALAEGHAAPWAREISAPPSFGRDTAAGYAGGCSVLLASVLVCGAFCCGFLGFLRGLCQHVERALDVGD